MPRSTTTTPVTQALEGAVEEMGRRLADHPERLRAVLLDDLGASARDHRGEVDAVVAAAEAGVPADLARRRRGEDAPDDAALAARVRARGPGAEEAAGAVAAWTGALRAGASAATASAPAGDRTATAPAGGAPDGSRATGVTGVAAGAALAGADGDRGADGRARLAGAGLAPAVPRGGAGDGTAGGGTGGGRTGAGAAGGGAGGEQDRRGVVLTWPVLVMALVVVGLLAATTGWLSGRAGSDATDRTSAVAATAGGMPGMSGTSGTAGAASSGATTVARSSGAAASSAPAPTSAAALTASDATQPDFTATYQDASGTWASQPLTIASTGTFDEIQVVGIVEKHGTVNEGADGVVHGTQLLYTPKHDGDFVDHVMIVLRDTATGATSGQATITVHALCDMKHPCVHDAAGMVMS